MMMHACMPTYLSIHFASHLSVTEIKDESSILQSHHHLYLPTYLPYPSPSPSIYLKSTQPHLIHTPLRNPNPNPKPPLITPSPSSFAHPHPDIPLRWVDTAREPVAAHAREDPFRPLLLPFRVAVAVNGRRDGRDVEPHEHHGDGARDYGRGEEAARAQRLAAAPGSVGARVDL